MSKGPYIAAIVAVLAIDSIVFSFFERNFLGLIFGATGAAAIAFLFADIYVRLEHKP